MNKDEKAIADYDDSDNSEIQEITLSVDKKYLVPVTFKVKQKDGSYKKEIKMVATYKGVRNLGFRQKDKVMSIESTILQIPSELNREEAIVKAIVKSQSGKYFTALGTANPNNVKDLFQNYKIEVAETRAKARALSDKTDYELPTFEEFGKDINIEENQDYDESEHKSYKSTTKKQSDFIAPTEDQNREAGELVKIKMSFVGKDMAQTSAVRNFYKTLDSAAMALFINMLKAKESVSFNEFLEIMNTFLKGEKK